MPLNNKSLIVLGTYEFIFKFYHCYTNGSCWQDVNVDWINAMTWNRGPRIAKKLWHVLPLGHHDMPWMSHSTKCPLGLYFITIILLLTIVQNTVKPLLSKLMCHWWWFVIWSFERLNTIFTSVTLILLSDNDVDDIYIGWHRRERNLRSTWNH